MTFAFPTVNLETIPAFASLEPEVLSGLYGIARLRVLHTGEVLFNQGDAAHSVYAVQSGALRLIQTTVEGKAVNLKVYGAGDIFGMLALSGAYPYNARIEASDMSQIICLHGHEMRRLMGVYPSLGLLFVDKLIAHVHHAHDRIRTLAVERTERRLARALVHFCTKFGEEYQGIWSINAQLTQQDIAEFTGTTPETVNRILRMWEKDGVIRRSRKHIDVLLIESLQEIINVEETGMAVASGE